MKAKISVLILTAILISLLAVPASANAATYQSYLERGIKFICYSKDSVTWEGNSSRITSYDAWQSKSGFLINLNGVTKLNKSVSSVYFLNFKKTLLAGAVISGVTIGYSATVIDQIIITNWGARWWSYDI